MIDEIILASWIFIAEHMLLIQDPSIQASSNIQPYEINSKNAKIHACSRKNYLGMFSAANQIIWLVPCGKAPNLAGQSRQNRIQSEPVMYKAMISHSRLKYKQGKVSIHKLQLILLPS